MALVTTVATGPALQALGVVPRGRFVRAEPGDVSREGAAGEERNEQERPAAEADARVERATRTGSPHVLAPSRVSGVLTRSFPVTFSGTSSSRQPTPARPQSARAPRHDTTRSITPQQIGGIAVRAGVGRTGAAQRPSARRC